MRIGIREQLGLIILLTSLLPLFVLALATWFNNYNFVVGIKQESLALTASLKAQQISDNLLLIQATCSTIVTRILLQQSIKTFYLDDGQNYNFTTALTDVNGGLVSGGLAALLQVTVYSRNLTGNPYGILNATATDSGLGILLPNVTDSNGTDVFLGDEGLGYPPSLYPNITYTETSNPDPIFPDSNLTIAYAFADYPLNSTAALFLGPLQINSSYALVSLTLPIIDNSNPAYVLGYMTVVAAATALLEVISSKEGLGDTGIVLIVGPNRKENLFKYVDRQSTAMYQPSAGVLDAAQVKYLFSPAVLSGHKDRHAKYRSYFSQYGSANFTESEYPAIERGFGNINPNIDNASSLLGTKNENGDQVAVGWARPSSSLVDWLLLVEQTHSEAWAPIIKLRNIVLACVFGSLGLILLIIVPITDFGVRPIRRLREATKRSVAPPGYTPEGSIHSEDEEAVDGAVAFSQNSKKHGFLIRFKHLSYSGRKKPIFEKEDDERRRDFRIPGRVPDRKHWIHDELTDLTTKFNEMSDELLLQYTSLEEKVHRRTEELEISKKAAEAANESKTLFIANISHELKTPLNGILGMTAVCIHEDDMPRIKRSLQVIYKSGDLLLNLLNDLLTFSKNQIGQQLSLEEKEFRLNDVKDQLNSIFRKQVEDGKIDFRLRFLSTDFDYPELSTAHGKALPALGPNGGRLKDMCLWGDQHRLLQVLINLVSNSLKFTPEGGRVEVRIRCVGEKDPSEGSRSSMISKGSSQRHRLPNGSSSSAKLSRTSNERSSGTALQINPMDPNATRVNFRERSTTPPPTNAKILWFEFEVEDTGPGIPERMQKRVFEPFVQGDLGLSKKHAGTGLGLSICSQLATLMGGTITLNSKEGEGTTFKLEIPLKFLKERAASTSSSDAIMSRPTSESSRKSRIEDTLSPSRMQDASPIATGESQPRLVGLSAPYFASLPTPNPPVDTGKTAAITRVAKDTDSKVRVLVAEDNLVNQEVVLRMLKLEDIYNVVIAKDGQEAYDIVKESMDNPFNLIFMDVQMPNLDGLQSTRLIRQMGYSAPIVALTAFSDESNMKECMKSGMDHFLAKPIRRPALKQVLKKFAPILEEPEDAPPAHNVSSNAEG